MSEKISKVGRKHWTSHYNEELQWYDVMWVSTSPQLEGSSGVRIRLWENRRQISGFLSNRSGQKSQIWFCCKLANKCTLEIGGPALLWNTFWYRIGLDSSSREYFLKQAPKISTEHHSYWQTPIKMSLHMSIVHCFDGCTTWFSHSIYWCS